MFGWTKHGAVTASSGDNTTKMRWQQRQKDHTNESSGLCHFRRYGSHFFCAQGCPKASKLKIAKLKNKSIFQRSHNSVGYKARSSRPSVGKFLANPHARNDVEPRPPGRTPSWNSLAIICKNKKTVSITPFACDHFSNTVCITVSNNVLLLFWNFENTVLLLLVNFVFFGLLFCILFKFCCISVGIGSKNYCFLPAWIRVGGNWLSATCTVESSKR